jgi:WD40 repeat protein/serine/threonine protein kinase
MADDDREQRLEQIIADYLVAEDADLAPETEALLAAHPDLTEDLRTFFQEQKRIGRLSRPLRAVAGWPSSLAPAPAGGPGESSEARVNQFGDYAIHAELGRGGMGVVYRAVQLSLNRPVALKMIKWGGLADDQDLRRFQNEAEAVALLDHPGIVPIYEIGEHEGQRYFSMKLITGGSLADQMGALRNDPRSAARLVALVAEAVHHAHMRGVLHRDLKPANILLDESGRPHVTDFGLARRVENDAEITASGAILGTPAYMSPEQASGLRGLITTATDVYGLGALIYAVLTGQAPFAGESAIDTLTKIREKSPEPPRKRNPGVPRDLEVITLKCLEKDPRRRYSSAQALADDLRAWLDSRPIAARPVGSLTRVRLWSKRRPALAALIAALVLAMVGVTALSIAYARQQADRSNTERALRQQAVRERDRNARLAYMSSINLAAREWQDANPARMRELLESTRPKSPDDLDFRSFEWFYLARLDRTPLWTSAPHGGRGHAIAFSPDGTWIATVSDSQAGPPREIQILDARDGRQVRSIAAGRFAGSGLAISPDGAWIASAITDHSMVVWDARSGTEVQRFVGRHQLDCSQVIFSPDGRLLASVSASGRGPLEREITVWNIAEKREIIHGHMSESLHSVAFSPDGHSLAMASEGDLQLWNPFTGKTERTLELGNFIDVAFSPDGRFLAGAAFAGWIGLWDLVKGARVETFAAHQGTVNRLQFSPDGKRLASAGQDRVVRLWDVFRTGIRREFRGHESQVWGLAFAPDGRRLASLGFVNGVVKLWDTGRGQESIELGGDSTPNDPIFVTGLAFSRDGRVLAASELPGDLQAWRLDQQTMLYRRKGKPVPGRGWVAMSPRAELLATLDETRSIVLRNPTTGALVRALDGSEKSRLGAFSPDGRFLAASGDTEPTIRLWEIASGRRVGAFSGHSQPVDCLAFSTDGAKLASGSLDTTVRLWDVATLKELRVYRGHSEGLSAIAFAPDGKRVASSNLIGRSGEIHLWDVATGQGPQVLRGHASFVRRLAFLPDGRRLVSLGGDGVLKLWDPETGAESLSIQAESQNGIALAISSDGRVIATSGVDSIHLWDSTP